MSLHAVHDVNDNVPQQDAKINKDTPKCEYPGPNLQKVRPAVTLKLSDICTIDTLTDAEGTAVEDKSPTTPVPASKYNHCQ